MYFFNESWKCLRIYMCAHNRKNKGKNKWKHSIELNVRFYYVPCFFPLTMSIGSECFFSYYYKTFKHFYLVRCCCFFFQKPYCVKKILTKSIRIFETFLSTDSSETEKREKTQSISFSSFWTTFGSKWFAAIDT